MMKRNQLYTVNRWNRPAFMKEEEGNLFYNGGPERRRVIDQLASDYYGSSYGDEGSTMEDYLNTTNAFGISKADNPFSKANIAGGIGAMANSGIGKGIIDAVGGVASNLLYKGISGDLSSGAGKAVQGITNTVGGVVSQANPLLGLAVQGVGAIVGGGINKLGGTSTDKTKKAANDAGTAALNSFVSNAESFDDVRGPQAVAGVQDAHKSGLLNKSWARKRNAADREARENALAFANNSVLNNINNIADDQMNEALANYTAFGGPLDMIDNTDDMGAINYGFLTDYLNEKKRQNDLKNRMVNMPTFMENGYAFGGTLGAHGSDFSTGSIHIDEGKSHSENPYGGVQMGVDENSVPNLVEEGEVVFNDYVYSNRIKPDEETKRKFHFSRKADITYADAAKKLEKEILERPNDPISKRSFEVQMAQLAEEQERQKQEMEAERARQAFEALSPEEQVAVMDNAAQQEQMAQEAAMQEQAAMAQQAPLEAEPQGTVAMEEPGMMEGNEVMMEQEPQMNCFGGKINRFDGGGELYKRVLGALRTPTMRDFVNWAKKNKVYGDALDNITTPDQIDWNELIKDQSFIDAIAKDRPDFADAISRGYFNDYVPGTDNVVFTDPNRGNWDAQLFKGWNGSTDDAWVELVDKWKKEFGDSWQDKVKNYTTKQMEDAFRGTKAYQNTTAWLKKDPENMRRYLDSVLKTTTSGSARKHALQFVNEDGTWKNPDNIPTYATVFGENGKGVRETYPGTYWHSVREANRGNVVKNLLWDNDTRSWNEVYGDIDNGWNLANTYNWEDENNSNLYRYYTRPGDVLAGEGPVTRAGEADKSPVGDYDGNAGGTNNKRVIPKQRWENLRYAGLFGPAVGLGMQALGIGRPDTSSLDAAIEESSGPVYLADYQPLGNYLTYRPMDIWFEQNRMDANARATDRNILNTSGGNRGAAMAGLLANGYNSQIADGELYRKALEYNDALEKQVAEFNRATDQWNSGQYGETSRFNAEARNRQRQANAQLRMQAAAQKADMDAGWYNSLYGNVAGLFKGLGDIGRENWQMNRIAEMAARGDFGTATEKTPGFDQYLTRAAKGGKIRKKKSVS